VGAFDLELPEPVQCLGGCPGSLIGMFDFSLSTPNFMKGGSFEYKVRSKSGTQNRNKWNCKHTNAGCRGHILINREKSVFYGIHAHTCEEYADLGKSSSFSCSNTGVF